LKGAARSSDGDFHDVVRLVDGDGRHAGDESVGGIGSSSTGGEVAFGVASPPASLAN
jgi:hypothetical protein